MTNDLYQSPSSNLELEEKQLSAAEKLAQSRRDMEESTAVSRLNLVWGVRLALDMVFLVIIGAAIFIGEEAYNSDDMIGLIVVLGFVFGEVVSIFGYFRRKSWCVIPLHIFSAISLLNIPVGTIFSILHYLNMHKIQFNKKV